MNTTREPYKLPAARLQRATEGFEGFCEEDLEWRKNSGEAFDEPIFHEARELIKQKLEGMKGSTP